MLVHCINEVIEILSTYHNTVLLRETVDGLITNPQGTYVDVTFGGGGHSKEILSRLGENGRLFAFDQDPDALQNAEVLQHDSRFVLIDQNFRFIKRFLRVYGVTKVDGILGDFGVSSYQFDTPSRGFSTRFEAYLDMRMDTRKKGSATALLADYSESQLADIFFKYGELRLGYKIARAIVSFRSEQPIETTTQLKDIISPFVPAKKTNKVLAQLFQAIRIEVNEELDVLRDFLLQTPEILNVQGRLSLISYHSLEDRLVKRFMRDGQFEGQPPKDIFGNVTLPFERVGKLIVPSSAEVQENPRSRSAKLRVASRTEYPFLYQK